MDREDILSQYAKEEERILVAKVLDKRKAVIQTNKIINTDFLDEQEQKIVQNVVNKIKEKNYLFFGGKQEAERKMLLFYPEKLTDVIQENSWEKSSIVKVIRITLPIELEGQYTHRDYLSAMRKLGVKREKIGDIIVNKEGADILVTKEIAEYMLINLKELTRFQKSKIEEIEVEQIREAEVKIEELRITVSSLRLDNIVAELAHTSRNRANEILLQERVFVNGAMEKKSTKIIKEADRVTIRGKGRFVIAKIEGNTKKGKFIVKVHHPI